jgi:hypothetical protein
MNLPAMRFGDFCVKHIILSLLSACLVLAQRQSIINVPFNELTKFGPDGPWKAVTTLVGRPGQSVDLYPGTNWESAMIDGRGCGTICKKYTQTGLYNFSASLDANSQAILWGPNSNLTGLGLGDLIGLTDFTYPAETNRLVTDEIAVDEGMGLNHFIYNTTIAVGNWSTRYPDGRRFPLRVGFLSLGAPLQTQSFDNISTNVYLNTLSLHNRTSSASWGMHIGSWRPNIPGSLVFGGYDISRIIGVPAAYDDTGGRLRLELLAIDLEIESAGSNLVKTMEGLLYANNSVLPTLPITIQPTTPYLHLPQATCDLIATYLPVTFNESLGLYMWDVTNPSYTRMNDTSIRLSFTFKNTLESNLTIRVPFAHLNLTIEPPLVESSRPYFPCRPYQPSYGYPTSSYLGRAFLQAAFVGQNWDSRRWFLAQAPGPKHEISDVMNITPLDRSIFPNQNLTWEDSWSITVPLKPKASSRQTLSVSKVVSLSVVLPLLAVLIAMALGLCCWHRKRSRTPKVVSDPDHRASIGYIQDPMALHEVSGVRETEEIQGAQIYEMMGSVPYHELPPESPCELPAKEETRKSLQEIRIIVEDFPDYRLPAKSRTL